MEVNVKETQTYFKPLTLEIKIETPKEKQRLTNSLNYAKIYGDTFSKNLIDKILTQLNQK